MSIYREWTDRHDSLNYGPEPLGLWIIRQAALDRKHYAEVEAKHRTEVSDLRKDLKEAQDYQVHLQRGWGQANAERDEARADLEVMRKAHMGNLEHLAKAVKQRDEARAAYKSLVVTSVNASACEDLMKQRDQANNRADECRQNNEDLRRELAEARAEIVNLKTVLKLTQDQLIERNGATLQRPIGRNEHDRRISRLEAKVANLELGGAR